MSDVKRVVIADDEPQVRETLSKFFSAMYPGCVIDAVADGEAAVAAVRRATPTLVMLDIEMPRKDGVTALKEIRTLASGVPVIMVTGNESSHVAGHVIGLGAYSYLPKPFRLQYLHHLVATVFDKGALKTAVALGT